MMSEETKKNVEAEKLELWVGKFIHIKILRKLYDRQYDIKNVKEAEFDGLSFEEHFVQSNYDDYKIPITIYLPKNKNSQTPIGVFMHGGGFQYGSRRSYHATVCYIAHASDTIWVSVEYR